MRTPSLKLILGGLAAGALALPIALVLVVSLVLSTTSPRPPFFRLESVGEELRKAVSVAEDGSISLRPGYRAPAGIEFVIEGVDERVLFSTLPTFVVGERAGIAAVSAVLRADAAISSFFFDGIQRKGRVLGRYYAWFSGPDPSYAARGSPAGILFLVGLFALAFSGGAVIAAQLARAVLRLEGAAGRIAAGDLEGEVRVRGIREIEDLARAMDGMRSALREDRDRRARFLAAVSHDLRTPLTSIGGYLEAVDDGLASDPGTLARYVGIMRDKTRLLEGRIASLIEFARMETGEWRMGFEAIELGPYLENLSRGFREDAELMGQRFEATLDGLEGQSLQIDRSLLARALENVVSNALRYAPEGGLVRLSARGGVGGLSLDIDDEGPGIAPADRERVFEPFYRAGNPHGEGSGLGLYIARSIVRGHGWEIEAGESPSGGGRISVIISRGA